MSAAENLARGRAFLEENASKDGITVTASGLQYEVLQEGDGPSPSARSTVTVHYRGTLLDGSQFDSSYERGEPISFPLNRVIAGWTEGLQLMQVGASYRFFIPSELAYGSHGAGGAIGPNETLIFEVELLKFN
jgi:FKBP-type peptidyl-prolyl cis-trans isomerase FkpA/FKBP-type peptidyl-prolyl cis-trans isomerase FklB